MPSEKQLAAVKRLTKRIDNLRTANAELLEALEILLRCSEYKATGHCQDCVPAAHEAIRRHKGE